MKVLIFSDNVAPYRIGWADCLAESHEVHFYYTKDRDKDRNDKWLVKKSKKAKLIKKSALVVKNNAISFYTIVAILKEKADIVVFDGYGIVPNMVGIWFMSLINRKYYINIDGYHMGKDESRIVRTLKKSFFSHQCVVLCGSQTTANHLRKYGVETNQIVVHNFSSIYRKDIISAVIPQNEKRDIRQKLGLQSSKMILCVGRFLDWKQFDLLIRAFVELDKEYQLTIIGEGPERKKYEKLVLEHSLENVSILEFMEYNELINYYKAADVFVLPSDGEVWGLVVNEAMCFGLPVITSDTCVAGRSLIEEGKNGYRFKHDSEDDLRDCIRKAIINEEMFSKYSLRIIQDYTIENMAQIHNIAFDEKENVKI